MKQIGIFAAKTHLSSLVDEVAKGGEVVITRHGRPVAKLVAMVEAPLSPELRERRRKVWGELREIRKRIGIKATHAEIKSWIDDGRH